MTPSVAALAPAAERNSAPLSCYAVQAFPEPGVMPRLMELFAKRGLVPQRWHSTLVASEDCLVIDIEVAGLEPDTAEYVARCMAQIGGVRMVLTD